MSAGTKTTWRWAGLTLLAVACGGGPRAQVDTAVTQRDLPAALEAYDTFRDVDGADDGLLAEVAALLLELEAMSDDEAHRRAALMELRLAGSAGLPSLHRIAQSEGRTLARAGALEALARRGDSHAQAMLYAWLDDDDPRLVAAAIVAIDAEEETARLVRLLEDPDAEVRRAAALQLAAAPDSAEALTALASRARVDAEHRVREAAVRSLGGFGAAAVEALRERLGDVEAPVRLAVVRALVRADREAALRVVAPLLAAPPSRAGIEAARVIALTEEAAGNRTRAAADARAYLRGALLDEDRTLRSQAAVALVSLGQDAETDRVLIERLDAETEPAVKLGIARALRGRDTGGAEAERVLEELMTGEGMPAVQAAAMLAADGREDALSRLEAALESDESLLRRVAVRAIARDAGRPDDVRAAMRDDDALVRIHAAGGILAAAN